ncbi:MAG: succinate dehydrogenase, cytochrome b556 subunit [Candidatus Dactylopiibacterium carminicum]|uniref:Succinate dehydrogenase cytochrome b556 subunit n=1 Tax=Candidatus Dactylopiibacterium carminicum TaxID=857335 RepID=A0A272EUN5_9RHOO|nr:succinate dehydrogenase, cytochrome b556 subunit [Candidatus Dactylopiibacterium carminicum]KAF7600367.1 succinate dehydrogenase, cytochrome b556 subunit [Candidatus Dactylopiibacterium carminicum]PAS93804.1 MAG: succinate dehydrogenase, cytochrome b556 subunit [Candidatus Dactylopiibacterium carminicum]PAT00367.1 MAG: succinate dehydrogenase, cytochrome b556 subunit [Candidatus Dactylopiibacterium carminicum]
MAQAAAVKARPKYLNVFLLGIMLPVPGFVSIFHRVSGAGLFLCMPLLIWLFGASLGTPEQFSAYRSAMEFSLLGLPLVKLLLLGLLWAYLHHFCAGIRFLLLDMHIGVDRAPARASAWAVFAVSLTLTVVLGGLTW